MPEYYPELAKLLFNTIKEISQKTGAKFFLANLSGASASPTGPRSRSRT
jgi:hypothetical protein